MYPCKSIYVLSCADTNNRTLTYTLDIDALPVSTFVNLINTIFYTHNIPGKVFYVFFYIYLCIQYNINTINVISE